MKKIIVLIAMILAFIPFLVNAKEINVSGKTYDSGSSSIYNGIIETSDNYYVAVGIVQQETEADIINSGVLVKYDQSLNKVKEIKYEESAYDEFSDVAEQNGSYVVVGNTEAYSDHAQALIVKYDQNGNILWEYAEETPNESYFHKVITTSDNYILVVGSAYIPAGEWYEELYFIIKFDQDGNIVDEFSIPPFAGTFTNIIQSNDGNYIVVGTINVPNENGEMPEDVNGNAYIVKIDSATGDVIYEKNYGGSGEDCFDAAAVTSTGDIIVVGESDSEDISGVAEGVTGNSIIAKLDNNGNMKWITKYGGEYFDVLNNIAVMPDDTYVVAGTLESENIPNLTNHGYEDALIIAYDKNGNLIFQKSFGGSDEESINKMITTKNNEIIAVGYASSDDIEGMTITAYPSAMILKAQLEFEVEKAEESTKNGTFELKQEGKRAEITLSPNRGYELDKIVVLDSNGQEVPYYEEDGKYYVDLTDDIVVDVKYKQTSILNPNTGGLLMIGEVIILLSILFGSIYFMKKKKSTT